MCKKCHFDTPPPKPSPALSLRSLALPPPPPPPPPGPVEISGYTPLKESNSIYSLPQSHFYINVCKSERLWRFLVHLPSNYIFIKTNKQRSYMECAPCVHQVYTMQVSAWRTLNVWTLLYYVFYKIMLYSYMNVSILFKISICILPVCNDVWYIKESCSTY